MTETAAAPAVRVVACGQYRFRVELPGPAAAEIADRAFHETTETFLRCTREFQEAAWVGEGNLAFGHFKLSPKDTKSLFFHKLLCLKTVELGLLAGARAVRVETTIPGALRQELKSLCAERGAGLEIAPGLPRRSRADEDTAAAPEEYPSFLPECLGRVEAARNRALCKRKDSPVARWLVGRAFAVAEYCARAAHVVRRAAFHVRYRAAFRRLVKSRAGTAPIFPFFESRSGHNRDVRKYLHWKLGQEFFDGLRPGTTMVPFTNLPAAKNVLSLAAMHWAMESLRRLERDPTDGCVVVNYLPGPWRLLALHFGKRREGARVRGRLAELQAASRDFLERSIYGDFRAFLQESGAFGLEIAEGYRELFAAFPPGVVLQAEAISKEARQFTVSARRRGGRVVYVADRICTEARTSNRLLAGGGDLHFPDRCVVFDQISHAELVRQGFPAERIVIYRRSFGSAGAGNDAGGRPQILVYLQGAGDNNEAMLAAGVEIARTHDGLEVLFQEHPYVPVGEAVKSQVRGAGEGHVRFLERGEKADAGGMLALVTGYSTAVIPGVLQGVPLIWLRRQVDNSVYGEAFLRRVGFPADRAEEAAAWIGKLLAGEPETLAACAAARDAARAIFQPADGESDRPLAAALGDTVDELLREISATADRGPDN